MTPEEKPLIITHGHTMKKRTKAVMVRLTEEEHQALLERKTKARLAEWLRELALDQAPKAHPKAINPELLFELNRIGVNLNQIARQCHNQKPDIALVSVATALRNIEKNLNIIRERYL